MTPVSERRATHGLRSIRAELEAGRAVPVHPHHWQLVRFFLLSWVMLGLGLWLVLVEARGVQGAERLVFGGTRLLPEPAGGWVRIIRTLAQERGRLESGSRAAPSAHLYPDQR